MSEFRGGGKGKEQGTRGFNKRQLTRTAKPRERPRETTTSMWAAMLARGKVGGQPAVTSEASAQASNISSTTAIQKAHRRVEARGRKANKAKGKARKERMEKKARKARKEEAKANSMELPVLLLVFLAQVLFATESSSTTLTLTAPNATATTLYCCIAGSSFCKLW